MVAISLLNWNGLELTTRCLQGLIKHHIPADIFVLDNGSDQDESVKLKQVFGDIKHINIERSDINLGFTGGNNHNINKLSNKYDYILLLNQDTIIDTDFVTPLVQYLEQHPKTAVTGPVVYNEDSTIQSAGASISLWTGKVRSHKTLPTQPTPVDCIVGNCFMMRTQAIKEIGQLTEKYFAYYEEADWCLQAKQHGWNCVVVPMAKLTHAKANNFRTYFIARNMVWFMKKFASPLQLSYFFCYYFTIFFLERLKKGSHLADLIRASQAGWLQHL